MTTCRNSGRTGVTEHYDKIKTEIYCIKMDERNKKLFFKAMANKVWVSLHLSALVL